MGRMVVVLRWHLISSSRRLHEYSAKFVFLPLVVLDLWEVPIHVGCSSPVESGLTPSTLVALSHGRQYRPLLTENLQRWLRPESVHSIAMSLSECRPSSEPPDMSSSTLSLARIWPSSEDTIASSSGSSSFTPACSTLVVGKAIEALDRWIV